MKALMEEYGSVILTIFVTVLLLIGLPMIASKATNTTSGIINVENARNSGEYWKDVSGEKEIIAFSVDGNIYYYEQGMTWQEWTASSYNTNNFTITTDACTGNELIGKAIITNYYSGEIIE